MEPLLFLNTLHNLLVNLNDLPTTHIFLCGRMSVYIKWVGRRAQNGWKIKITCTWCDHLKIFHYTKRKEPLITLLPEICSFKHFFSNFFWLYFPHLLTNYNQKAIFKMKCHNCYIKITSQRNIGNRSFFNKVFLYKLYKLLRKIFGVGCSPWIQYDLWCLTIQNLF